MLANQRLATSKLAVKKAASDFVSVDYEGDLCQVSQAVRILFDGDLAVLKQSVELDIDFSGDLCSVSQSVVANYDIKNNQKERNPKVENMCNGQETGCKK